VQNARNAKDRAHERPERDAEPAGPKPWFLTMSTVQHYIFFQVAKPAK